MKGLIVQVRAFFWLLGLTLALTACSGVANAIPSLGEGDAAPGPLEASGFIEAQEVNIVSEVGGRVAQVLVDEADPVSEGQVVLVLDDALLQADRRQAEAAVAVAEANLAELLAGPGEAEVEAAQAAIDRAAASLAGARNAAGQAWAMVSNPHDIDAQIASTQLEIATLRQQVDEIGGQITQVEYELRIVEEGNQVRIDEGKRPDETRVDFLNYTRQTLIAQQAAVQARLAGAEEKLALLQAERERPVALIAQARNAQSQIGLAEAQLELAQMQYDLVVADPRPEEVAIMRAQVDLAEAQVALIDARIAQLTLVAPIDGVVTTRSINAGETATAGVSLLTISDLDTLKLVVYIPETQIGRVRLGAPVEIKADAYPTRTFMGEVVRIGREAEFTPRNVQTEEERVNLVFAVEIRIANEDGALKPGMPADVVIETQD